MKKSQASLGRTTLFTSFFLFFQIGIFAQPTLKDSIELKQNLQRARSESSKIKALEALIDVYWNKDNAQAAKYINQLLPIAEKSKDDELKGFIYNRKAGLYYLASNLDSAILFFNQAAQHYEKANNQNSAIEMHARVGLMDCLRGNYAIADSVYRDLIPKAKTANTEPALAFLYNQMGTLHHYQYIVDSTLKYYTLAEALYGKLEDSINMLRPMYNRAVLQTQLGDLEKGLGIYLEIINIQERLNVFESLSKTLSTVAHQYRRQQLYQEALVYSYRALEIQKQLGDNRGSIRTLVGIADSYRFEEDYEKALKILEEALSVAKETEDQDGHLGVLTNKASILTIKGDYSSALATLSDAQPILNNLGKSRYESAIILQLGHTNLEAGNYEEAKHYLNRALVLAKQNNSASSLNVINHFLAKLYFGTKKYKQAIEAAETSYSITSETKDWESSVANMKIMADAYEALGDLKASLDSRKKFDELKDSLNQIEKVKELTVKTKEYEFEREKQQIEAAQLKKEMEQKARTRQTQLGLGGVTSLAIMGFIFLGYAGRKNRIISHQNQQLNELNQTKDHLFSIIGHDLRKPVIAFRNITKKINYLVKKEDFQRLKTLGMEIEKDALALQQLTDNLLNWALTQKKIISYHPEHFLVADVTKDLFDLFQTAASEKAIELQSSIPNGLKVHSDLITFKVILRNLIDNAVKYTPEGGKVEVTANSENGHIQIFVKDSGVGIPKEQLKDLFVLKHNKSNQGTAGEQGTGLGLHLVKELVKLNKGRIEVKSEIEKGSVFCVEFAQNGHA